MRILHCADLHLGRRRLNGRLPDADLADALRRIVARAVEWRAHVFLIAGDLFDTPQIAPPVLRQACEALEPLKKSKIPVLAIEGNHDRFGLSGGPPTWVRYLADEGLLKLLHTPFTADGPVLTAYDPKSGEGSMLSIDGVRFVGAGYLGAGTDRKARAIAEALPQDHAPTVMLLHAGPEYFVGEGGGFRGETLTALQERIAYLALGHIHKPMTHGGEEGRPWAINPGSPENCRLDEADVPGPRGWAEVEIEPHALPGLALASARIVACPRRPVIRVEVDISKFGNKRKEGAEAIEKAALKEIKAARPAPECVVRLFLTGEMNIGRIAAEPLSLADALTQASGVVAVEVNLDQLQLFTGRKGPARSIDGLTTEQIETLALMEVLADRRLDGLEDDAEALAELYRSWRVLVARNAGSQAVIESLEQSSLPKKWVDAQ